MPNKKSASSSLSDLLPRVRADFSGLKFTGGARFAFHPPRTVVVGPDEPGAELLLLHEVAHAILGHRDFKTNVERLKIESAAWEKARDLAARYSVKIDEDLIQDELDTYREWLHKKSRCPQCGLTRFQGADRNYHCPRCENLA